MKRWPFWARSERAIDVVRLGVRLAAPIIDIWARFALAQIFFVLGMLRAGDWHAALSFAVREYSIGWPETRMIIAFVTSTALLGPILFATGLLVRPAAAAMLIITITLRGLHGGADAVLFCAVLFGWYATNGAGWLSLDRVLVRGLETSALPFAAAATKLGAWMDRYVSPAYRLALRLWLAAMLIGISAPNTIFPPSIFAQLPQIVTIPAAILLVIGLATPLAAGVVAMTLATLLMINSPQGATILALILLALLGAFGAGRFSFDHVLFQRKRRMEAPTGSEPHIVIVGGGFGGMACAASLRREPVRVTLIDRNNYHLFQPLLYQVATAGLSPGDIATPIRDMFRDEPGFTVIRGVVSGVDAERAVISADGRNIGFDYLVLATGASHSYFGNDAWARHAPGLKTLQDAVAMRGRILDAFEKAEATHDLEERNALLTFLICGGGPTGVELAGAIADLARHGLKNEFRRFDPSAARIILVEAGSRLLAAFPEKLSTKARTSLEQVGVDVRVGRRVEAIDEHGAIVNGERIRASTVLWAAGVMASPAATWLGQIADRAGRVKVTADLSVPGMPNIFAIGDTALTLAWNGTPVPGLAPAAKQAGVYVANVIASRIQHFLPPPPFCYHHLGSLATIGRKSAVADFGRLRLWGSTAWWLWGLVHVVFLVGLRNRLSVVLGWAWSYFTYRLSVQLITGDSPREVPQPAPLSSFDTPG